MFFFYCKIDNRLRNRGEEQWSTRRGTFTAAIFTIISTRSRSWRWVLFSKSNVAVLIPPRLLPRANRSSRDITWEIDAASNGARRVFPYRVWEDTLISPGPRHRVDAQVLVVVEFRSSTRFFLTSNKRHFTIVRSDVLERQSPLRIRIADYDERNFSLLSIVESFVFLSSFLVLNAIKILQQILRGDLTPGQVLNSLGGFEKACTGNRITRVCPRRLPLRPWWPKRKCRS